MSSTPPVTHGTGYATSYPPLPEATKPQSSTSRSSTTDKTSSQTRKCQSEERKGLRRRTQATSQRGTPDTETKITATTPVTPPQEEAGTLLPNRLTDLFEKFLSSMPSEDTPITDNEFVEKAYLFFGKEVGKQTDPALKKELEEQTERAETLQANCSLLKLELNNLHDKLGESSAKIIALQAKISENEAAQASAKQQIDPDKKKIKLLLIQQRNLLGNLFPTKGDPDKKITYESILDTSKKIFATNTELCSLNDVEQAGKKIIATGEEKLESPEDKLQDTVTKFEERLIILKNKIEAEIFNLKKAEEREELTNIYSRLDQLSQQLADHLTDACQQFKSFKPDILTLQTKIIEGKLQTPPSHETKKTYAQVQFWNTLEQQNEDFENYSRAYTASRITLNDILLKTFNILHHFELMTQNINCPSFSEKWANKVSLESKLSTFKALLIGFSEIKVDSIRKSLIDKVLIIFRDRCSKFQTDARSHRKLKMTTDKLPPNEILAKTYVEELKSTYQKQKAELLELINCWTELKPFVQSFLKELDGDVSKGTSVKKFNDEDEKSVAEIYGITSVAFKDQINMHKKQVHDSKTLYESIKKTFDDIDADKTGWLKQSIKETHRTYDTLEDRWNIMTGWVVAGVYRSETGYDNLGKFDKDIEKAIAKEAPKTEEKAQEAAEGSGETSS